MYGNTVGKIYKQRNKTQVRLEQYQLEAIIRGIIITPLIIGIVFLAHFV